MLKDILVRLFRDCEFNNLIFKKMKLNYSNLFCFHIYFPTGGLASRLQNLSAPGFCLANRYSLGLHGVREKIT